MALDALKNIRKTEQERVASYDRPKTERLPVKAGTKVEIVFLEELEDTAETHTVREWSISGNGTARSLLDGPDSYAAQVQQKFKQLDLDKAKFSARVGWKVYFSVAKVDEPDKTYFFSQSATSALLETLLEDVEEEGGITGVVYRISKGPAQSDSWQIKRLPKAEVPTVTAKPYNIKDMVIDVAVEQQPKYLAAVLPASLTEEPTSAPVADNTGAQVSSDEW